MRRVAIGVSGGVDSAVAALLLKNKGFDVQGVFMKNWDTVDEIGICSGEKDYEDARIVCKKLNIPLVKVDFVKQYWNDVFCNLIKDYESGFTPNPDILCNRHVKFKSFYEFCREKLNVDAIATGHYANTSFGPFLEQYETGKGVRLLQPRDKRKDQTFFLSQVEQEPLRRTMFPLATLLKSTVRSIAKENHLLNVANKKDSSGICFVGERNFQNFISEYIPNKPGIFVDIETGKKMGNHFGIHQWTLGQRCRLSGLSKPYFIFRKNMEDDVIYVVSNTKHSALKANTIITSRPHWIYEEPSYLRDNSVLKCFFRFQNTHPGIECRVMKSNNKLFIVLDKCGRAITEGQYAVLYSNYECYGSARIIKIGPSLYFTEK